MSTRRKYTKKRRGQGRRYRQKGIRNEQRGFFRDAGASISEGVQLKLTHSGRCYTAIGTQYVYRFNPNAAFNPITGASPGGYTPWYDRWALMYGYYRVIRYSYKITVINNEAFPIVAYIINSNNDPTDSIAQQIASNPLCQTFLLSAKGGQDRMTFRKTVKIAEVVGTNTVKYDDMYSALITANPTDVTWLGIGAASVAGGSFIPNGASFNIELKQFTVFYDRLLQQDNTYEATTNSQQPVDPQLLQLQSFNKLNAERGQKTLEFRKKEEVEEQAVKASTSKTSIRFEQKQ